MKAKNQPKAGLCSFVLNIVTYYDIFVTVEPKRKALSEANAQLLGASSKLETVMQYVAEIEQKLAKLTISRHVADHQRKLNPKEIRSGAGDDGLTSHLLFFVDNQNRWNFVGPQTAFWCIVVWLCGFMIESFVQIIIFYKSTGQHTVIAGGFDFILPLVCLRIFLRAEAQRCCVYDNQF